MSGFAGDRTGLGGQVSWFFFFCGRVGGTRVEHNWETQAGQGIGAGNLPEALRLRA